MVRWAWRLFRRDWRQQILILALVAVAVAATILGAAVATNTPPPANAGFGTANHLVTFPGTDPAPDHEIGRAEHFGKVDVIENETVAVPGSVETYHRWAQNTHGAFGGPMLSLVLGHYPAGAGEVAVTPDLASILHLSSAAPGFTTVRLGRWSASSRTPRACLTCSLRSHPASAAAHPGRRPVRRHGAGKLPRTEPPLRNSGVQSGGRATCSTRTTIVLTLTTLGMLLIALVGVGGFTVLALNAACAPSACWARSGRRTGTFALSFGPMASWSECWEPSSAERSWASWAGSPTCPTPGR